MIHIVQQFTNFFGGSERHALGLYDALKLHTDVKLWSEFNPDERFMASYPIELIQPKRLRFPKTGTIVFVGACWYVGKWINYTNPNRIIVIHNYPHSSYQDWFVRLKSPWLPKVEWAFVSQEMKDATGLEGALVCTPINIADFDKRTEHSENNDTFVVGRHSRDVSEKFHDDDPELFVALANLGIKIRIMGGTNLKHRLPSHENIELLPQGYMPAADFLNGLSCFLYRTSSDLFEAFGRVVDEAMASSLPVVCGEVGGYKIRIKHGNNGYLFSSNQEAIEYVTALRENLKLRESIANQAFETVMSLYANGLPDDVFEFYLRKN